MSISYPSPRPRMRFRAIADAETAKSDADHVPGEATRIVADAGDDPILMDRHRKRNKGSFKKGQSGNPKGRPRGAKGVKAMVRKAFDTRVEIQTARGPKKVAIFEALLKKEVSLAAEGDWRARKTVFDLGKWALGESQGQPFTPDPSSPEELTATGQAIIAWFKDEVTADARAVGDEQ